jgi:hypothetical protein
MIPTPPSGIVATDLEQNGEAGALQAAIRVVVAAGRVRC